MGVINSVTRPVVRSVVADSSASNAVTPGASYTDIVASGVLFGDATFTRASSATYFNSSGVLSTATTNTPRVDYNPATLALRGLLVEESRTNIMLRSEEFDDAAWSKSAITVTANNIAAPDGNTTADLITATSSSGSTQQNSKSVTSGAITTISVFAKAGTAPVLAITPLSYDVSIATTYFNLSTGEVGTTAASHTAAIQDCGGGWYRCEVRFSSVTDLTGNIRFNLCDADGSVTVTSGRTQYWWGAQMETGAFASSYIPTTTASVTRAADVCSVSDLTDIAHDATVGTIYLEGTTPRGIGASTISTVSLNDGTANEVIAMRHLTGGTTHDYAVTDGGVSQVDTAGFSVSALSSIKHAASYAANDFKSCVNGGTIQTDTSGTLPTVDRMTLNAWNGWIATLRYYPSAEDTQALTT